MKNIFMVVAVVALFAFAVPANADINNSANADTAVDTNATVVLENGAIQFEATEQRELTTNNNRGHGYRGFANPAETNFPGMPGYLGPTTKGPLFQGVTSMLEYKNTFTLEELDRMAGSEMFGIGTKVIVTPLVEKVDADQMAGSLKVVINKPKAAVLKGYITVKATNNGTVSPEVMAEAMLAARELGANAIRVSAEGVERVIQAFGWGVGLGYTKATISADEAAGSVGSGGTGISGGTAGYKDRPWIQLFAIDMVE